MTTTTSTTNAKTTAMMTTGVQADQEQENDNGSEDARTVFGATQALKTLFGDTGLWLYFVLHVRDSQLVGRRWLKRASEKPMNV